jgi:hypothetical protein
MKKVLFLLFVCGGLFCCAENKSALDEANELLDSAAIVTHNDSKIDNKVTNPNWQYTEETDEMTGKKSFFTSCQSENILTFDFPYDGGSIFTLGLRKNKDGRVIFVTVSKGQFLTSYDGSSMRVKFDDEPPLNFSCNGASDGSADVIFINSYSKFVNKLKKAKKISIEPEFYQEGKQIVRFKVEGLNWEH